MVEEPILLQNASWQDRLAVILDMTRAISQQTDPQEMVQAYGQRMRRLLPSDAGLSLSRRGLTAPWFRITRSSMWKETINPWKEKDRLPLLKGGLLADLLYGDEPVILDDFPVAPDDPAREYLAGYRSLMAIPMFDQGTALNMVLRLGKAPAAFSCERLPELVWMSNLFGRATHNLVLSDELKQAYEALDREFRVVGEIQRSLLPAELPHIPTLQLAAYYQPSERAGGDYYDFFPLPDGRWGVFIADVSGHGTPAAVLMAITHCIAHTYPGPAVPPAKVLNYLNCHLATRYTDRNGNFVTAFYGIYDPANLNLTYSCAGHNPPRLKRCQDGSLLILNETNGLPLGISADQGYRQAEQRLQVGDQIVFYTDGVTEAHNVAGEMFGTDRLDRVLENCSVQATGLLDEVLRALEAFTAGHPAEDDRTVVVARIIAERASK
jgi:sigma-B regulation protein RsbU (phosphoserine phosphatase)